LLTLLRFSRILLNSVSELLVERFGGVIESYEIPMPDSCFEYFASMSHAE
jgi:hypothetical protein